eukprot:CAMPEP_0172043388 /NCGR_PEP_ID=MMETSP1041-20130122/26236_1 /TAXON_ID=464988 /ORGANISM="Hemiselmis andersenii, Strain CCMP439" /LENGTH=78 /DNA_ID=CAMNT_0012701811 /DNA_START=201 /DNA_END=434 /DNA_ORIENTATION=-
MSSNVQCCFSSGFLCLSVCSLRKKLPGTLDIPKISSEVQRRLTITVLRLSLTHTTRPPRAAKCSAVFPACSFASASAP